jgi:hypothetical protein
METNQLLPVSFLTLRLNLSKGFFRPADFATLEGKSKEGLLNYPKEPFSHVRCGSAIESERVFVQVGLKVFFLKPPLEYSKNQTFDQGNHQMDPWQNAFFVVCFVLKNLMMFIAKTFQLVVALPAVRGNGAGGFNIALNKWGQFACRAVLDYLDPQPPQFFSLAFHGNRDSTFVLRSAASFATALTSQVKLIGLYLAGKLFALLADGTAAKLLEPAPGRAVTAQFQEPLRFTALTPDLRVVNHHIALNQALNGLRVPCMIVPAVKEC